MESTTHRPKQEIEKQESSFEKSVDTTGSYSVEELHKTFDEDVLCGFQFGFTSKSKRATCLSMQNYSNPKWSLICMGFLALIQGFIINGYNSSIIYTLEKKFELSSGESGLIASCYDIASCLLILPLTYFGAHANKPQVIGLGGFLISLGALIFSIPSYISPDEDNPFTLQNELCSQSNVSDECLRMGSPKNYKYCFYSSFLLIGAGATPLYTLTFTYFDENVKQRYSALFHGIFMFFAILGPAIGFVAGGQVLKLPSDITKWSDFKDSDVGFGAWWLGYVVAGLLGLFISVPICMFPRDTEEGQVNRLNRSNELHRDKFAIKMENNQNEIMSARNFVKSVFVLLRNPVFLCISLGAGADTLVVNAFATFGTKYVQSIYGYDATLAALYWGSLVISAAALGQVISALMISKLNLNSKQMLQMCVIAPLICIPFNYCLKINCGDSEIVGITKENYTESQDLKLDCNERCLCDNNRFEPVCLDGNTYFSACHAGCDYKTEDENNFSHCACENSSVATSGACEQCSPDRFTLFCVLIFVYIFATFFNVSPGAQVSTMRVVGFKQRSLATGVQWILIRLVGSIPGPLVLGKIFDDTCVYLADECGDKGACLINNTENLSHYAFVFGCVAKVVSFIFNLLAMLLYQPEQDKSKSKDTNRVVDSTTSEEEVGDGNTSSYAIRLPTNTRQGETNQSYLGSLTHLTPS